MLAGEIQAEKDKAQAAKVAFSEGNDEAFQFFEKSMKDETKHKKEYEKSFKITGKGLNKLLTKILWENKHGT